MLQGCLLACLFSHEPPLFLRSAASPHHLWGQPSQNPDASFLIWLGNILTPSRESTAAFRLLGAGCLPGTTEGHGRRVWSLLRALHYPSAEVSPHFWLRKLNTQTNTVLSGIHLDLSAKLLEICPQRITSHFPCNNRPLTLLHLSLGH